MSEVIISKDRRRISPPNSVEEVICGVCGDKMDVERNVKGAPGFAAAMAGMTQDHDIFNCPNWEKRWHLQVRGLMRECDATNSAKLTTLLQLEIDEILKTRKETKRPRNW